VCLIRSGAPLVFSKETTFAKKTKNKNQAPLVFPSRPPPQIRLPIRTKKTLLIYVQLISAARRVDLCCPAVRASLGLRQHGAKA
jgi:hypothetical protein